MRGPGRSRGPPVRGRRRWGPAYLAPYGRWSGCHVRRQPRRRDLGAPAARRPRLRSGGRRRQPQRAPPERRPRGRVRSECPRPVQRPRVARRPSVRAHRRRLPPHPALAQRRLCLRSGLEPGRAVRCAGAACRCQVHPGSLGSAAAKRRSFALAGHSSRLPRRTGLRPGRSGRGRLPEPRRRRRRWVPVVAGRAPAPASGQQPR
mmetsp:Transcript_139128/g.444415  ORF Transcript_139128/g.444415 Transcript_139128/m.444415 type:complete len:204 (+) Transcript_139128:485-1096(+)